MTMKTWFRAHLKPNDILFVNKGTPGRVCIVPDPVTFCAAQDMMAFRCDENQINYKYLFAVLRSKEIQKIIENNHVGLVIPHFRKQELLRLLIPIRPRTEQELIGNFYFVLSEKIELNNRINAELEADFKNGKGFEKNNFLEGGAYFVFGSNGIIGKTNSCLFSTPVIAIGRVGANCGEISYSLAPSWITDNAVTSQPFEKQSFWWLLYSLRSINFANITGGSAQPLITQGKLKSLHFSIPPQDLLFHFYESINPFFELQQNNSLQNQQLASLRDWLLPMLMNGQVKVK